MKKTFPRYKRRALKDVEKKFKPKDKEMIQKYLVFCSGSGGKTTVNKYHSVLIKVVDVFGGDMDKIDLDRLRDFLKVLNNSDLLPATKNEIKKVLKRFLREFYDDWVTRFKNLKDIKTEKEVNQNKINANTILRENEIKALMDGCRSTMYKAFIMTLFESASRPEELLKVKWKDINLDKGDIKLVSSKTGNLRINPLQNAVGYLKQWKHDYCFPDVTAEDWVFVNYQNREKHISRVASGLYIKRLGQTILKRDIWMYLIRHTRATELQKKLPGKIYEKFMDHSLETATRYSHLNKDDVREAMFDKVYKVEELTKEQKNELEKLQKKVEQNDKRTEALLNVFQDMSEAIKKGELEPQENIQFLAEAMKNILKK